MDSTDKQHFFGMYRGIVALNKDPDGNRRLQVKVPQLSGDQISNWAWPAETASLKAEVPAVGDGVWVMYEGGDPSYPLWVGTFGKDKKGKRLNVKVLPDETSLSGLSAHIITERTQTGTTEIDLMATILALANKVKTLESKVVVLETWVSNHTQ